jgi:hypothetical protein
MSTHVAAKAVPYLVLLEYYNLRAVGGYLCDEVKSRSRSTSQFQLTFCLFDSFVFRLNRSDGFTHVNAGLLGAARWPDPEPDWNELYSIGFRWVICAATDDPGYDPSPLEFLQKRPHGKRVRLERQRYAWRRGFEKASSNTMDQDATLFQSRIGFGRSGNTIHLAVGFSSDFPNQLETLLCQRLQPVEDFPRLVIESVYAILLAPVILCFAQPLFKRRHVRFDPV